MSRKLICSLFLALCLAGTSLAQKKAVPLDVQGDTVLVVKSFPCKVVAPKGGTLYDWSHSDAVKTEADDNVLTVTAASKGTYKIRVRVTTISFEDKKITKDFGETTLVVGEVPGPGPVPPGPDPVPPPPDPKPDAPFPSPNGLAVLMVFESAELSKIPRGQYNSLYAKAVWDYLKATTYKDNNNKDGAWRIWDKDEDPSAEEKVWQEAMKVKRASTPWIVISNGKTGFSGPLPDAPEKTIDLIKKYAPAKGGKSK